MTTTHWKKIATVIIIIALCIIFIWGIYLPWRRANEIMDGLSSKDNQVALHARKTLYQTRYLGLGKNMVTDKVRKMLVEANDDELCPLIIMVGHCSYRGTGVDLVSNPADQKIVMDAVERFNKYANEKRYPGLRAVMEPNGKLAILPDSMILPPDSRDP